MTIISTLLGIVSSTIPSLINYWQTKSNNEYSLKLTELKIAAAKEGLQVSKEIADFQAIVVEGNNLRSTDAELDGGEYINTLRASVRPVITYTLFAVFIGVKFFVAAIILMKGDLNVANMKLALDAILDDNTMAITSTVIGYYFGARALEKFQENVITNEVSATKPLNKLK